MKENIRVAVSSASPTELWRVKNNVLLDVTCVCKPKETISIISEYGKYKL